MEIDMMTMGQMEMLMRMMTITTWTAGRTTRTTNIKMAIYCPQGSGTLRQQLLMMH